MERKPLENQGEDFEETPEVSFAETEDDDASDHPTGRQE